MTAYTKFLIPVAVLLSLVACNSKQQTHQKAGQFEIYHLQPNSIIEHPKYKATGTYYELSRDDFFALKNFDVTNEEHKVKLDKYVLNHIKNDSFLIKNHNTRWTLVFFKYGDGITESTKHQFDTDYTMHTLFAYKKRQVYYAMGTRGEYIYKSTGYYFKNGDSIASEKRKLIVDFIQKTY